MGCFAFLMDPTLRALFTATYISIVKNPTVFIDIAQIGFIHDLNAQGNPEWCRFWFNPSQSTAQDYSCSDNDNAQVYFKIETYGSQPQYYGLYDCGTGGDFSNCTIEDGSTPAWTSDEVQVESEADYPCVVQMLGQNSDRVWYGNSNWATSILDQNEWSVNRNWANSSPTCSSDYLSDNAGSGLLRTWDPRNTS